MQSIEEQPAAIARQLFKMSLGLQKLNKRLERVIGMTLVQWYVLSRLLEMPGVAPGILAKEIGVHPGTLTPLLQRLKRKGLLYLERDDSDSRKKVVLISREGHAKLLKNESKLFQIIDGCSDGKCTQSNIEELLLHCNRYSF